LGLVWEVQEYSKYMGGLSVFKRILWKRDRPVSRMLQDHCSVSFVRNVLIMLLKDYGMSNSG